MKIKKFSKLTNIYQLIVILAFVVYNYFKLENGTLNMEEEKYNILTFGILILFGASLTGKKILAENRKEKYISMKAIYGGLGMTVIFVLWRVIIGIF
ncbi:hypothetical protein [Robertmurraya sp. P23]|uniref:hypothetical protein n=1 Tax=Robertmurraya sp. P23 TaxID=3436931 RepID=UPI003D95C71F